MRSGTELSVSEGFSTYSNVVVYEGRIESYLSVCVCVF